MLEEHQTTTLIRYLSQEWPPRKLVGLLHCGDPDARNTALVCLALTGTMAESAPIAGMLHDESEATTGFAEQALWSIWFRASDDHSNRTLNLAVRLIEANEYEAAIEWLSILALRRPQFAEVFNQRAIARFLTGRYAAAIADTNVALRRNPLHFGAMAIQGHCHAAMHDAARAAELYHAALQIHPRMEGIRESLEQVARYLWGESVKPDANYAPLPAKDCILRRRPRQPS